MRCSIKIGISSGVVVVATSLLYVSLPVIVVTDDTPPWRSEYDASRQFTTRPGPGTPLSRIEAGGRVRVLWDTYGKDYHAYFVVAPHWQRGWLLDVQHGIP